MKFQIGLTNKTKVYFVYSVHDGRYTALGNLLLIHSPPYINRFIASSVNFSFAFKFQVNAHSFRKQFVERERKRRYVRAYNAREC